MSDLERIFLEENKSRSSVAIILNELDAIENLHKKGFSYRDILKKLSEIEGIELTSTDLNNAKIKNRKQTKTIENKTTINTQPKPKTFTPSVRVEARKEEKLTTKTDEKCVNEEATPLFYFEGEDINSVKFSRKNVENYEAFMKYLAENFDEIFFNSYDWDWEKYTPMRYLKKNDYDNEARNFMTEKDFIQSCVFYAGVRSKKLNRTLMRFPLENVLWARMEAHRYKNRDKDNIDNYVERNGPL